MKDYKMWEEKEESVGDIYFKTKRYQKRLDLDDSFKYPLCQCNDKLHMNIIENSHVVGDKERVSFEIYIVAETKSGDWVDLKFYGLPEGFDVSSYENKLLEMWKIANE